MIQTEPLDSSRKQTQKLFPLSVTYLSKGNLLIFSAIAECFYCVAWQLDNDNITGKRKPLRNQYSTFEKETQNKC